MWLGDCFNRQRAPVSQRHKTRNRDFANTLRSQFLKKRSTTKIRRHEEGAFEGKQQKPSRAATTSAVTMSRTNTGMISRKNTGMISPETMYDEKAASAFVCFRKKRGTNEYPRFSVFSSGASSLSIPLVGMRILPIIDFLQNKRIPGKEESREQKDLASTPYGVDMAFSRHGTGTVCDLSHGDASQCRQTGR
jgi:hypothetical protein